MVLRNDRSALLLACFACCAAACSSEPNADDSPTTVPRFNEPGAAAPGAGTPPPTGSPPTVSPSAPTTAVPSPSGGGNPEQGVMPTEIASQAGASGTGPVSGMEGMAGTGMTAPVATAGSGGAPGAAGSAGAPMPPPAASRCPATALFCDDFEDDALGQFPGAPWQNQTGSGATVRVDALQAFSGTHAVHVNSPAGAYRRGYFSLQNGSGVFPGASREMFGREMLWLDATPNATVHWTIIQAEGRAANGTHDAYYRYGGQQQGGAGFMANYETNMGVSTDCYSHSATRIPTQAWACVEWHFSVATNEMQMWLNGRELTDLHVIDRPTTAGSGCLGNGVNGEWLAPPAFTTLHLGWEQYQQHTNDTNLWVDDVVISTERVGCPAP
jgi:hypothetical protein